MEMVGHMKQLVLKASSLQLHKERSFGEEEDLYIAAQASLRNPSA